MALDKPVKQIGRLIPAGTMFSPYYAVDGDTRTSIQYCSHDKDVFDPQPVWWIVDLERAYDVHSVVVTNRGDCCGKYQGMISEVSILRQRDDNDNDDGDDSRFKKTV